MNSRFTELIRSAPAPDDAERRLERLLAAASARQLDPESFLGPPLEVLRSALHKAPYLAQLLVRDPSRLLRVSSDPYLRREKPGDVIAAELAEECRDAHDADELATRLRRYRADELVRLGFRELELGTPMEVGRELAALADAAFDEAIFFHRQALDKRFGSAVDANGKPVAFTVIGMGKLGGRELNFASDVDVIYAYDTDDGAAGDITLHDYFTRLARAITSALGEVTDQDTVFRVDLRLRPEGSRGALVNSVLSMERYYESFGRPWERQAWLKARPCAGDLELGEEIRTILAPFVYPRLASATTIDEVHELNQRIKVELVPGGVEHGFDVKNGIGGIREVEFFVQALQLVHAGKLQAIRSRTTLTALDQLLMAGLVSEGERQSLSESYRFLRHVEHVLQLEAGRQTQRLPGNERALELLARRLGEQSSGDLQARIASYSSRVAAIFATLGDDAPSAADDLVPLVDGDLPPDVERSQLASMGFADPDAAMVLLERARTAPASPFTGSASRAARRQAPKLLDEIARCAAPDQALDYLVQLIRRRGSWAIIWGLLDESPELTRLVITLFATSAYLSKLFVSNPELTDALLPQNRQVQVTGKDTLRALAKSEDVMQILTRDRYPDEDWDERRWNQLAELKSSQVLRIGLADIAGEIDSQQVCRRLSDLADVCLERSLSLVEEQIARRHGIARGPDGEPAMLAVMAVGKLGGQELGYASDLDVVFVYSDDGESDGNKPVDNVVYMTRTAQRLMGGLHALHRTGRIYELDTRLRPSGRRGLLVSSWQAWQRYHMEDAELWEQQALTKLRFAAGDYALGHQIEVFVHEFLYGEPRTADEIAGMAKRIAAMRERIERELGSEVRGYDIKTGKGGIIDIEFAAQFLQLANGHHHESLHSRTTTEILAAANRLELAEHRDLTVLEDGYRFLRRLEHRMRIMHDRPVHK
ncbi:MAG: bifunctional [glutamate--ammonia ligase]-adenylyl-L-tyrosine phosphorylase/[glutamate--ammonia-ligase] adenylyltransferase, partial [Deltaproteobacteria bacterium]|nr:bifunctional [glutamate--ammonia ligase]-adenylyl-L-tyrosine phosphorylase/[glutamate--ammonia-ligase] adenylyltransferase [Deltaproteobacteria bacterium]